jgi:PAS domain S-box-containing protein
MIDENTKIQQLIKELEGLGIIGAISDGISIQDTNFKVLYQNNAHKKIVGGDRKGEHCYKAYACKEHICEECPVEKVFKDGKFHTLEKNFLHENGAIYIEIKASPLKDFNGQTIAGIEVVRDITERKRVEHELRDSKEKYKIVFEKAPIGIMHFKQNGDIVNCNEKFAEIIGATKEKTIDFNLIKQLKDKQMKTAIKKTLANEIGQYEGDYFSIVGKKLTSIKAVFGPILSDDGAVVGGIGVFEDITERKVMEKELINKMQELVSFYNISGKKYRIEEIEEEIKHLKNKTSGNKK